MQETSTGLAGTWVAVGQVLGTAVEVVALCFIAASTFSILGVIFADWWHVLDLLGQFAIPAIFGAAVGVIIEALRRRWTRSLFAMVVVLAGIAAIWRSQPIAECEPGASTHRIVFFNIWVGNAALADTLAYLEQSNADVIVLTELTPRSASALAPLQNLYPNSAACSKNGTCWTAAFSRTPFTDTTSALDLPGKSPALSAMRLPFADGEVTIAGVHLTRPWPFDRPPAQRRQLDALAQGLVTLPGPQIVVGDFNAVTWSTTVNALVAATGLRPIPSWGTWMAGLPTPFRIPIDQALVSSGIACATKTIGPMLGSDHRPIIVDFALQATK